MSDKSFFERLNERIDFLMNFFYLGIEQVCQKFGRKPPRSVYFSDQAYKGRVLENEDFN